MGTLISESAAKRVEAQVNRAIEQGAKLVCGNERHGAFYGPTVLDGVDASMDIAHDVEVSRLGGHDLGVGVGYYQHRELLYLRPVYLVCLYLLRSV